MCKWVTQSEVMKGAILLGSLKPSKIKDQRVTWVEVQSYGVSFVMVLL